VGVCGLWGRSKEADYDGVTQIEGECRMVSERDASLSCASSTLHVLANKHTGPVASVTSSRLNTGQCGHCDGSLVEHPVGRCWAEFSFPFDLGPLSKEADALANVSDWVILRGYEGPLPAAGVKRRCRDGVKRARANLVSLEQRWPVIGSVTNTVPAQHAE